MYLLNIFTSPMSHTTTIF